MGAARVYDFCHENRIAFNINLARIFNRDTPLFGTLRDLFFETKQ